MIKRMNKVTSLLIAAAAVVSIMPATGVSAATRLETKEGTIQSVVAFSDGKYIYDGYKTQDDETGIYYNAGDKDKLLEDLNADSITKFGDKYISVVDGSDDYLVDLSTGKVAEDTAQEKSDNLKTKLKAALSKTDRYGKISSVNNIALAQISKNQFGTTWYSYTTTGAGVTTSYSGYTNEAGKYIDTDYTANMYVFNGTKMVKIDEFGKEDTDNKLKVDLVSATTIAQDNDSIYRIADVTITNTATTTTSTAAYIQKISKAQGEQKDGAYLPKTVTSYEISSAYDSTDADDAKVAINDTNTTFRVINGVLYATKNDGSKVTVTTIKLKKDKVTLDAGTIKLDAYLAEQDVQEDNDIAGANAVSMDVDGNTWALYKGEIVKFDGTAFKTVYNVDRAMNTLEVYNADSLIAWEAGQDVYATVDKKTTETPIETPVVTKGWVKATDGTWTYNKADGTKATGWLNDNGTWYLLNGSGAMKTGWVNDNGTWYLLNGSGAMKTGWVNDNGTWYFLNGSGAMKTGWLNDNGTWYYLNASGAMAANTTVDGYKLNASGAWVK